MIEPYERRSILRLIRSDRPSTRQSMETAGLYAGQVMLASLLLMSGYHFARSAEALWAVVSVVLVIQPVIEQSLAASVVRIAANSIGGIVGILVGRLFGDGMWQILLALAIVVLICERLRLDLALRTACVSVAIIMMRADGRIVSTGEGRLAAVVIGCVTGLVAQLAAEAARKRLGWREAGGVVAPAAGGEPPPRSSP